MIPFLPEIQTISSSVYVIEHLIMGINYKS